MSRVTCWRDEAPSLGRPARGLAASLRTSEVWGHSMKRKKLVSKKKVNLDNLARCETFLTTFHNSLAPGDRPKQFGGSEKKEP